MATAPRTLIKAPAQARRGEVVAIQATIGHPMETGLRTDGAGQSVPRSIIRRFEARFGGELVFAADLHTAIAANPYLAFHMRALESGTLELRWSGEHGFAHVERLALAVT